MPDTNFPSRRALIDLSVAEWRSYSIVRAMLDLVRSKKRPAAGLEFEVSAEVARLAGMNDEGARSLFVPTNLLASRAVTAIAGSGNSTGGGSLIGTELDDASFINALRPVSRVLQLGARTLPNLRQNTDLPRVATGATAAWVSDGDNSVEDESVFDKVPLKPHILTGYAQMTHQMAVSTTPEMEGLVRGDIARAIGTGLDAAAIAGSGIAPVPTGILATAGIGSVSLGANGGAVTVAAMDDLEAAVTNANVFGDSFGYLTTPAQVRKLRGLVDTAGRPIWQTYADPDAKAGPGHWNGHVVVGSNNVPSNLSKGTGTNLSAIIFGNWSDLVLADWGFIELRPNRFGAGFQSGGIELNALLFADVGVRHPQAFAAIVDAT